MKIRKRKSILPLLLSVSLVLPVQPSFVQAGGANLSDHLLGYYTFDGNMVDTDAHAVTNEAASGEAYTGTMGSLANANATSIKVSDSGISGKALKFTGNSAESYFKVPQIIDSSKDYTVSAWLNFDTSSPADGTSINVMQQTDAQKNGRTVLYARNKVLGTFVSGSDILGSKSLTYGEWMHVTVSGHKKEDGTNQFQVYINGILEIDNTITSNLIERLTDLQFGCHKNTDTGYNFSGLLDEVRIYDTYADAAMVQALFQEHGTAALYHTLTEKAAEARQLLEDGLLPEEDEAAAGLLEAAENSEKLTPASSCEVVSDALQALTDAIDHYRDALKKLPVSIELDPEKTVSQIPNYMFGTNHRYHMDSYGAWNTETNSLYPEFTALSESASFGSIRYPGGIVSNLFQWKKSIGPREQRKTTIHGNWDEPSITPNFGVDEAARYIIDDSGSEMIYVYGFGNGSAADASDLVEYLNCEVGENPNGGIDWAQVRLDNGHPQPYGVKNFEIGNEVDEGRGYWMMNNPNSWSNAGDACARMYAEGAERTFTKEKTAEADNWNTTNDRSKASHYSDGTAGQKKYMRYANDVSDQADKSKAVQNVHVYVNDEEWQIIPSLAGASPEEQSVQVDAETGEILFGDGVHGKIPASGADIRVTYTVYKDGISDYYDAMKAVDPEVKIYSGFSNPNIARIIAESPKAGADGGKFDGIAVHPYSRTNGQITDNDPQFYEKILDKVSGSVIPQITQRTSELNKYWPDGSKKAAISEYGIFNHSGDVVQSQTHAVYIAENLINFVNLGAAYTNKHCLIDFPGGDVLGPGKQALILAEKQSDGVYRFYGTPSLGVFTIFNTMSGTQILETRLANNRPFYASVNSVNAMGSMDGDGTVYCIAVNTERDDKTAISLKVDGVDLRKRKIEMLTLTSDDVYDVNSLADPDKISVAASTLESAGEVLTCQLPPHSVTGFKITPAAPVNIPVTGVSLNQASAALDQSHITVQLKGQISPPDATNQNVTWESSDPKIASVDNQGLVTAVSSGQCRITVTTEDEGFTAVCTITVKLPVITPVPDPKPDPKPNPDLPQKPGKITGLKIAGCTASSIRLTWNGQQNASSYQVQYCSSNSKKWNTAASAISSYTIKKLKAGGKYKIRILAVNSSGKGDVPAEMKAVTEPAKPSKLSVRKTGSRKIKLTWKKINADGYQVFMKTGKTNYKPIYENKKASCVKGKLKPGVKYTFRVRGYTKYGKAIGYGSCSGTKTYRIKQ